MIAIKTKYLKATKTKGERITARTTRNRGLEIEWDSETNEECNHKKAAYLLAKRCGLHGNLHSGKYVTGEWVHLIEEGYEK